MDDAVLDQPLEVLSLGERPYVCLTRAGITTVRALTERSSADLLRVVNFGAQALQETRDALWQADLWLRDGRWGHP